MSDSNQARVKRAAPAPQLTHEPAAPVEVTAPEPEAAELAEPTPTPTLPTPVTRRAPGADRYFAAYAATLATIGESQAAVASDLTAMTLEMSGLTRASLMAVGDGLTALLTARNLVDAVEAQLGAARRGLDTFADGSTRLGGLGLRLASDAAKPMLRPFTTV